MLSFYTLDVCVGDPVEIFEAPDDMRLKELLNRLGLEKGAGGASLQLRTPQRKCGEHEKFPSDLLLLRNHEGKLVPAGAMARVYTECRDFAVLASDTTRVFLARSFATHLMHYDPAVRAHQAEYANIAFARDDDAPS